MSATVSLHTLGCKLNYSETSFLAKKFEESGYDVKKFGEHSDIFILNTCSVTENADKECRQIIRSVLRKNPETYVIITGCYAQLQPEEIAKIQGVDIVLGANEKFKALDYVSNLEKKEVSCIYSSPAESISELNEAYSADTDSRTRAFLKIQDGCDYKCTFCTIPLARGSSRSISVYSIIENAKRIIDAGYKEIVVTGVNTGDYEFQNGKMFHLSDVLQELEKLPVKRLRVSSIEPNLLTDEIIDMGSGSGKLCNHFHIPLQSGSDKILKLMRRRYNRSFYKNLIEKIVSKVDSAGIGVDVITGFPGETEEDFEETYSFIAELPVSYLHVFTYSERRNTLAASMPGKVSISERKRRTSKLRLLSEMKKEIFIRRFIGSQQSVLFESDKNDMREGLTTNYIRVNSPPAQCTENEIYLCSLDSLNSGLKVSASTIFKLN